MFEWTGRFDGEEELYHRIFQRVTTESAYENINPKDFVLHGFAVDEGVKRNKGRIGAQEAPDLIRKNMSNSPVVNSGFSLKDFGNIKCENNDLEATQDLLAEKVSKVLLKQGKSVVLGGGHEVTLHIIPELEKLSQIKRSELSISMLTLITASRKTVWQLPERDFGKLLRKTRFTHYILEFRKIVTPESCSKVRIISE